MIDVHGYELTADSLYEQGGNDRAVDTSGEGEEHLFVTYLTAYKLNLLGYKSICKCASSNAGHIFRSYIRIHI